MRLHAAAILVIFCLGVFTARTAKGSIGSQSMRKFRCVDLSAQKWNIQSLVSYERQQVPVNAIIFLHSKGFKICVSPEQKWVQAAMKKIDQKRNTKGK